MDKKTFSITAAKQAIKLDSKRLAEASFTVTNASDKQVTGQLKVRPVEAPSVLAAQPQWFGSLGDTKFAPQATTQVAGRITVPPNVPPGKYGFRLDAVSAANPDDDYTEGPLVVLEVPAPEAVPVKRFPWWIAVVAGVVVLALIGGGLWFMLGGSIVVPDVVKDAMPIEDAKAKIKQAQLEPVGKEQKVDGLTPDKEGRVVKTEPAPNTKADKGSQVTLFYQTSSGIAIVPLVTQKRLDAAKQEVESAGLKADARAIPFDSRMENQVIDQSPRPGDKQRTGSAVILFYAGSSAKVPDVITAVPEAMKRLQAVGLTGVTVHDERCPTSNVVRLPVGATVNVPINLTVVKQWRAQNEWQLKSEQVRLYRCDAAYIADNRQTIFVAPEAARRLTNPAVIKMLAQ